MTDGPRYTDDLVPLADLPVVEGLVGRLALDACADASIILYAEGADTIVAAAQLSPRQWALVDEAAVDDRDETVEGSTAWVRVAPGADAGVRVIVCEPDADPVVVELDTTGWARVRALAAAAVRVD